LVFIRSSGNRNSDVYIAETNPFESAATATFPGHVFLVKSKYSDDQILHKWIVTADQVLYVYDPFESGQLSLSALTEEETDDYFLQKNNLEFSKQYKAATGIDYLSLYPLRPRPLHPMWPAEYFGQKHTLISQETHFIELPPPELLTEVIPKAESKLVMEPFRQPEPFLNLTLTVLSCSPRVLEISNFLSKVEIDHIMKLATGMTLHQSATKAGTEGEDRKDDDTRTSRNTWVRRGKSPIIDALFRRSADLMQIDEAYLRPRLPEEMSHLATKSANAEQLQLVHYAIGQQYTPHHDFTVPAAIEGQPMRFATILFYLNDGMEGGETTFPRWLNAETKDELRVVPETGKAVLFYSLLPDGNMDERSQHASVPVRRGEKWLTNLWTWDPMMRF
jgi:prolyl 4-hydroxylase